MAGGRRALPHWNHEPIRSFVFQTEMGDGEAQATGTGRICKKITAKCHWSLGVQVSPTGDIKIVQSLEKHWISSPRSSVIPVLSSFFDIFQSLDKWQRVQFCFCA